MDFWDLSRLFRRRWRISVPMMLLAVMVTALTFTQTKPDYTSMAYVQLVSPVVAVAPKGSPAIKQRNPWLSQDLKTLGNAALVTVDDLTYVHTIKVAGYSDSFTATMGAMTPLITFEVTGKSMEQTTATTDELVRRFNQSLLSLQTSYGVTTADLITSKRLDDGTNIAASNSNVKRALIAIAMVGGLLTAAVTILADAWLRRRTRRETRRPFGGPTMAGAPF